LGARYPVLQFELFADDSVTHYAKLMVVGVLPAHSETQQALNAHHLFTIPGVIEAKADYSLLQTNTFANKL
jgi:hypothetical protein